MIDAVINELDGIDGKIIIAGDGAGLFEEYAKDNTHVFIASEPQRYQNACGVAIAAEEKLSKGETVSADQLRPFYLRLPQAERELKAKSLKGDK
jgi:tRNA threonylcarbamoyladenosine biosynthesis protein TsaB